MTTLDDVNIYEMLVIPEDIVAACAQMMCEMYGNEETNSYENILLQGNELKDAGRTPVYLCTQDMRTLFVTSKEKINKEYH